MAPQPASVTSEVSDMEEVITAPFPDVPDPRLPVRATDADVGMIRAFGAQVVPEYLRPTIPDVMLQAGFPCAATDAAVSLAATRTAPPPPPPLEDDELADGVLVSPFATGRVPQSAVRVVEPEPSMAQAPAELAVPREFQTALQEPTSTPSESADHSETYEMVDSAPGGAATSYYSDPTPPTQGASNAAPTPATEPGHFPRADVESPGEVRGEAAAAEVPQDGDVIMDPTTTRRKRTEPDAAPERRQPLDKICLEFKKDCIPGEFILSSTDGAEDWAGILHGYCFECAPRNVQCCDAWHLAPRPTSSTLPSTTMPRNFGVNDVIAFVV